MSAEAKEKEDREVGVTFAGYLEKKGNMRWQQRWFELHGDTLLYFNEKGEKPRGELILSPTSTVGALSAGDTTGFQVIFAGGKALKVGTYICIVVYILVSSSLFIFYVPSFLFVSPWFIFCASTSHQCLYFL
jgi:hypothetical protein